jgi:glycosyltransferase involved in cell wall biosynthesis
VGIVPEIIKDGENGFIIDGSAEELSEKIIVLSNKTKCKEFRNKIIKIINEKFNWDDIIRQYVKVYANISYKKKNSSSDLAE